MVCTFLAICSSFSSAMAAQRERTFIMVKPDGVQRGLIGKIITRFEDKGLKLVAMKFMQVCVCNELPLKRGSSLMCVVIYFHSFFRLFYFRIQNIWQTPDNTEQNSNASQYVLQFQLEYSFFPNARSPGKAVRINRDSRDVTQTGIYDYFSRIISHNDN